MLQKNTEKFHKIITRLAKSHSATREELLLLLKNRQELGQEQREFLFSEARRNATRYYGNKIYLRGLIEISSFCRNDCFYCGLRRSNGNATRYRLSEEEILTCVESGKRLGLQTFVLQGGEDSYWTVPRLADIIRKIKKASPTCAVTLSLGEMTRSDYAALFEAGADRYLLRHEAASEGLYSKLHPKEMPLSRRLKALKDLASIGYQVGSGFMVGRPFETIEDTADDLIFLKNLAPSMVGIGPFVPQADTPLGLHCPGTSDETIFLLAVIRLLLPSVLLPATTALITLDRDGYEKAVLAGANVIMPSLTPQTARQAYKIYDGKASAEDTVQQIEIIGERLKRIGYEISLDRGDAKKTGEH